jgi:beta-lactamase class A
MSASATQSREDLERAIDRIVASFSGEIGLAAKNLATGETIERNADVMMPTASVIKLAVLVEVFRQATEEGLDLDRRLEMRDEDIVRGSGILKELGPGLAPTARDLATLMVVLSDNTATNMLIDLVGGVDAVNRSMHDRLGLNGIVLHNRVDFARIGDDVSRFGESTPRAMMQLVEMLVSGEVIDESSSKAMLDIMQRQQYLDQAPRYIAFNPYAKELQLEQSIQVGCKTGFFPGTRADAGFVRLPGDRTIVYCLLTDKAKDTSMVSESEGVITNGLLGRTLLEYWLPEELAADVLLGSPFVSAMKG